MSDLPARSTGPDTYHARLVRTALAQLVAGLPPDEAARLRTEFDYRASLLAPAFANGHSPTTPAEREALACYLRVRQHPLADRRTGNRRRPPAG